MKKKILLDRFKGKSVFFFYNNFKESNFDIKIITFSENNCETLKNFDGELLSDFEIARGSFFKDVPWILDNKDLEFFSKYSHNLYDELCDFALISFKISSALNKSNVGDEDILYSILFYSIFLLLFN